MAEIVIDPGVPEAARRELEQASLSALAGFSDPRPGEEPPGQPSAGQPDESAVGLASPRGARVAVGVVVAAMAAAADDAVRRANEAGRALVIPPAD